MASHPHGGGGGGGHHHHAPPPLPPHSGGLPPRGAAAAALAPPTPAAPDCKVELPDAITAPNATRLVTAGYDFNPELDQIGEGTYGRVYRGRDLARRDKVALKMIRTDSEREGFPITAIREIKILSSLKHENIVNLREIVRGEVDAASGYKGAIYMVFDYAEHDLTGMIDSHRGKLTVPQVKCLMLQLLKGLSYCHLNGVLHRDLKAANILITRDGVLKLADFGLARTYLDEQSQKMTNRVITLWYRPPELLLGAEHYDPKVDVWSVGCIFAELLSGKPLFPGRDEADTLRRILELMGLPTNRTWPGIEEWPFYRDVNRANLREDSNAGFLRWCKEHLMDQGALPLLQRMLALDPRQRISASDALMDPYLWESPPPPCRPSELPKLPDAHEFTTKRNRDKRQHQQQQQHMQQQQQQHPHMQQQQHYAAGGSGGHRYAAGAASGGGGHGSGGGGGGGSADRNVRPRVGPGGYGGGAPAPAAAAAAPPAAPYTYSLPAAAPGTGAGRGFHPASAGRGYAAGGAAAAAAPGALAPPGYPSSSQQQRRPGGGAGGGGGGR